MQSVEELAGFLAERAEERVAPGLDVVEQGLFNVAARGIGAFGFGCRVGAASVWFPNSIAV